MNAIEIKQATERTIAQLTRHPEQGLGQGRTTVRAREGLTCEAEGDGHRLIADLPESCGGGGRGPDPGFLIRAALGSCLAMDCWTWAARLGVPLDDVEIGVESQLDARGMYGLGHDVPPGYQRVTCSIRIASPADRNAVIRIAELAMEYNPRLYDMRTSIAIDTDLTIVDSAAAVSP